MRINTLQQNKFRYFMQKLESHHTVVPIWELNKARKGYSIVLTHSLE